MQEPKIISVLFSQRIEGRTSPDISHRLIPTENRGTENTRKRSRDVSRFAVSGNAHWSRRITRSDNGPWTHARARVRSWRSGRSPEPRFARPWLSRGRRVTGWSARVRIQDRDRRDSFYGCVMPSAATTMNQPPLFFSSRCTIVSLPPLPTSSCSLPLHLFLRPRRRNVTRMSRRPPSRRRLLVRVTATEVTGNSIFGRGILLRMQQIVHDCNEIKLIRRLHVPNPF